MLAGLIGNAFSAAEPSARDWGLPPEVLAGLSKQAEIYAERSYRFACIETEQSLRYRPERSVSKERRYEYSPGGIDRGNAIPEFRLRLGPDGRVGKPD
jgi:hypothetical protein